MPTKKVVKKSNVLINAAYAVTLAEQRLILLAIAKSGESEKSMRNIVVHAADYSKQYKVTLNTAYEALKSATAHLFERRLSYQRYTDTGHLRDVTIRWVSRVEYGKSEGLVTLSFSNELLPLLCDLKSKFTHYALEQISDLKSAYAIRLYELLIAWRSIEKTPIIEVADLRRQMGLEDNEYPRMDNFKRRVLDCAISQINECTDIVASYEQHKHGRSIFGFQFKFESKTIISVEQNETKAITSDTDSSVDQNGKRKRRVISKSKAESMARPGEEYQELYRRLSCDYIIK